MSKKREIFATYCNDGSPSGVLFFAKSHFRRAQLSMAQCSWMGLLTGCHSLPLRWAFNQLQSGSCRNDWWTEGHRWRHFLKVCPWRAIYLSVSLSLSTHFIRIDSYFCNPHTVGPTDNWYIVQWSYDMTIPTIRKSTYITRIRVSVSLGSIPTFRIPNVFRAIQ